MFTEEKTSFEQEMLIREAVESAEQGFTVYLKMVLVSPLAQKARLKI